MHSLACLAALQGIADANYRLRRVCSLDLLCCRYGEAGLVQGYPAQGGSSGVQMTQLPNKQ